MKELFRHHDSTTVALYRSILEQAGIPIMFRNESVTMSGITLIPIPEFYPNICVMNDGDYAKAKEILRKAMNDESDDAQAGVQCPSCSEKNPGNFEICYACGEALTVPAE